MTEFIDVSAKAAAAGSGEHDALGHRTRPALVLVNLGTPTAPTTKAVRTYLREFLSDRRVIEMHPLLWKPILEGIILRVRPARSAAKYRTVWLEEGSPLKHYTERQVALLAERFGGRVEVRAAMRYGEPALTRILDDLYVDGYRRIAILSAYPQYSQTTVGSINDALANWMCSRRDQVELRTLRSFPLAPAYIEALARALETHWDERGRPDFSAGDRLLASFHSIPVAMHEAGDPYHSECLASADALRRRLEIPDGGMIVTFQSVFGPAQWLKPATIDTVEEVGKRGTGRVDVVCPGFVSDCLETLEEIDQLNRKTFLAAGGGEFHYVPWGNDSEGAIGALAVEGERLIAGWIESGASSPR